MLIGNKFDLLERKGRVVTYEEGKEYAEKNELTGDFIETTAMDDHDLTCVPQTLANSICVEIEEKNIDPTNHKGIEVNGEKANLRSQQQQQKLEEWIILDSGQDTATKKKSCC